MVFYAEGKRYRYGFTVDVLAAGHRQTHAKQNRAEACPFHAVHQVGERLERGVSLAVWGAGSKGVTFLNLVEGGADIHTVVDVNERKRGRFVPGTGQAIIAPEELARLDVGTVLVMNPNYREEIQQQLSRIGISPEVLLRHKTPTKAIIEDAP